MWARAVSEFGAIVILTYNPKVASVLSYDRFTGVGLDAALPVAAVLVMLALVPLLVAALASRRHRARRAGAMIEVEALCTLARARSRCATSRSRCRPARGGSCSARPARGRRRCSRRSPACVAPSRGASCCAGPTSRACRPERRGVGIVYQHALLFPHLTVEENVRYGADEPAYALALARRLGAGQLLAARRARAERRRAADGRAGARARAPARRAPARRAVRRARSARRGRGSGASCARSSASSRSPCCR